MLNYYKHQFVMVDRTLEIYFSGCHHIPRCHGCHNYELWEITKETKNISGKELAYSLKNYATIAKQVHILGGEPLEQDYEQLLILITELKHIGFKNVILFTGYDIEILQQEMVLKLALSCDYVKFGKYEIDNPNKEHIKDNYGLNIELASKNQFIISQEELKEKIQLLQ